ncbi:MAG: thiamine phosphate synthase [Alphaproteobacteria bacterium]|nr:thiamine phosphate synthase [Alphaproteobacteria bacterium]
MNHQDLKLYLVTHRDSVTEDELLDMIEQSVLSGVSIVQLREKDLNIKDFTDLAIKTKKITDKFNVPLIINDNVEVAKNIDAAGIHVGQKDSNPTELRKILGPDKIIGLSIENIQQAEKAQTLPIDYIAASPVFCSNTKMDTAEPIGKDELKEICVISQLPVVAIGGINFENINDILDAKASGVAISSLILKAGDIKQTCINLRSIIDEKI